MENLGDLQQPSLIKNMLDKINIYKFNIFIIIIVLIGIYFVYQYYLRRKANKSNLLLNNTNENSLNSIKISKLKQDEKENNTKPIQKRKQIIETKGLDSDVSISSDINKELAKIKHEENMNISYHNLTNSEIEDINDKLTQVNDK